MMPEKPHTVQTDPAAAPTPEATPQVKPQGELSEEELNRLAAGGIELTPIYANQEAK